MLYLSMSLVFWLCTQAYVESRKTTGALASMDQFGVSVLKASCWPPLHMFSNTVLPPALNACVQHFKAYFEHHFSTRTVGSRNDSPLLLCSLVTRTVLSRSSI